MAAEAILHFNLHFNLYPFRYIHFPLGRMRSFIGRWLALCFALALGTVYCPGAGRAPVDSSTGLEYVRISDWARSNNLEMRWLKKDETFQLTNRNAKIVLTVDSREAQINGIVIWLNFPVADRNGSLCMTKMDMQYTFQPILTPPRQRSPAPIKLICLDPGHGGKDPGNFVGSNQEKKYNLLLAQEVSRLLARAGLKSFYTRSRDTYIELPDRADIAKSRNADLFVSLHFNAASSSRETVQGTEVFCLTPAGARSTNTQGEPGHTGWCTGNRNNDKNMWFAYQMQRALTRTWAEEDRGIRRARFAVLRDITMPGILIEAGFMSHPTEGKKIFDSKYRTQLAQTIVNGILAYKRSVERGS